MLPETTQNGQSESALKRRISMGLDDPNAAESADQVDVDEFIADDTEDILGESPGE